MFYTASGHKLPIEDTYKGKACFLVLSGPSLLSYDLARLQAPGIMTFGVNNSPKAFRPNLWTMVDDVGNFMSSIWLDPRIMKFAPLPKAGDHVFDNVRWEQSSLRLRDCPNVVYYKRNEEFNHETFLTEDTINWGNHGTICDCGYQRPDKSQKECKGCGDPHWGGRSVMLAAVRIIRLLGFTKLFILGADFSMDKEKKYAFDQDRTKSSIRNNNNTYALLNKRFDLLKPIFDRSGFYVFNCLKESGLKSFPHMDFDLAVRIALKDFPDTATERSAGMYERKAEERKRAKQLEK